MMPIMTNRLLIRHCHATWSIDLIKGDKKKIVYTHKKSLRRVKLVKDMNEDKKVENDATVERKKGIESFAVLVCITSCC